MTDHALTPETLAELEQAVETLPPGPFEVYENIHAEAAVAEAGRGGFGVVALPATGREDYGRAYIVAITTALNHLPALIAAARAVNWWADQWEEARSILRYLAVEHLDEFSYDELSTVLGDQPIDHEGENYLGHLTAERDAALAEVAALRERITALADDAMRGNTHRGTNGNHVSVTALRAALDVDTAGHDDSSERDGGR